MKGVTETFVDLVRNDPLFAAVGMDLERAETALDAIQSVAREFEEAVGGHSLMRRLFLTRYPLTRYAIPLSFIRAFIESERCRRHFLANPTGRSQRDLLEAWDVTCSAYGADVARFTRMHRILLSLDRKNAEAAPLQDMHGNTSTLSDINHTLRTLRANADRLRVELIARQEIAAGKECSRIPKPTTAETDLKYRQCTAPARYAHLHELELTHSLPFRRSTILEKHGPFAYELSQFDGTPTTHPFMLYIVRDDRSGTVSLKISALDLFLFQKIGPDTTKLSSLAHLRGKGIPYWYQPSTNFYTMRDQTYWADVSTIVDIHRRPSLDAQALRAQKSSLIDLLLGACVEDHQTVLENAKDHMRHGTFTSHLAWYWVLMRTHPSIYYLPFNESVWRIAEKPNFLGSGRVKPEGILYRSADAILEDTTAEQLELIMQSGRIREEARKAAGHTESYAH